MDGRCRGTVTPGFVGGWQANPAYLIGERVSEPTDRDRLLGAMKLAVELFRAPRSDIWNWGGVTYYFAVRAVDDAGNYSAYSSEASATPTGGAVTTITRPDSLRVE